MSVQYRKKTLKVLHISTAKTWRGGEQQIAYLVEGLAKRRVEQLLFSPKGSSTEHHFLSRGMPHHCYQRRSPFDLPGALTLRRVCERNGIDLMHAHDSHAHSLIVLSSALCGNSVPGVVSRRVDIPVGEGVISQWKYNHASVRTIVCVSRFIADMIRSVIRGADRLKVVYSGVDLEKFSKKFKPTLRKEYQLPENHILIGNVSAIAGHKDYRTFVEVAERLLRERLDATYFIVGGDGGEERMIRELVTAKGLEKRIIFTGFREDAPAILSELDLLLFTSKTEGLGTTVLDAFVAGTPVVATEAGGLPEIVRNRLTGLTAAVGDAAGLARSVQEVLSNSGLRTGLVSEARKFVQEFSKEKTAEQTLEIYRETLNRP